MRDLSEMNERLKLEFDGRLRVRWSGQYQHYSIEQKFTKALTNKNMEQEDDEMLRAREGYLQVCAVSPGDRMACERCKTELKVPVHEFRMISCPICKVKGMQTQYVVGYFDLDGDRIIEHLRSLDPLKGTQESTRRRIAENNQKRQQDMHREAFNRTEDYVKDGMEAKLFGIPQTAINKTDMWVDQPQQVITNEKQKVQ